jgi:hypothetical protein
MANLTAGRRSTSTWVMGGVEVTNTVGVGRIHASDDLFEIRDLPMSHILKFLGPRCFSCPYNAKSPTRLRRLRPPRFRICVPVAAQAVHYIDYKVLP